MSKLITGFALGVIATIGVGYWLDETPGTQSTSAGKPQMAGESFASQQSGFVHKSADAARQYDVAAPALEAVEAEPEQEVSSFEEVPDPVPRQRDAGSENSGQRSSATTARGKYPPEIADMIEKSVDKDLQARYEDDRREESWAIYMEGQLAAYFAQKPALAHFTISLIDCRTSVCSVHVLGYGLDALTQWNTATADLVSQQWFEFNNMSMNRRNPAPDILAVVLILTKKPG